LSLSTFFLPLFFNRNTTHTHSYNTPFSILYPVTLNLLLLMSQWFIILIESTSSRFFPAFFSQIPPRTIFFIKYLYIHRWTVKWVFVFVYVAFRSVHYFARSSSVYPWG
jgi:hypothetical protein